MRRKVRTPWERESSSLSWLIMDQEDSDKRGQKVGNRDRKVGPRRYRESEDRGEEKDRGEREHRDR